MKLEPMKPAPPVTRRFMMFNCEEAKKLSRAEQAWVNDAVEAVFEERDVEVKQEAER